jgi:hypothetical protein
MTDKHIAKSGKQAGQWVACGARIQCENGGLHVSSEDLTLGRMLHYKKLVKCLLCQKFL